MPKQTDVLSPTEQARADEEYQAELDAIRNSDMPQHERPPEARTSPTGWQPPPREQLISWGLTDAEIIKIMRGAAQQQNNGMVEYDEEVEAERLDKLREQRHRMALADNGASYQTQLSAMETYFTDPMRKRYRYMSPRDETVGINGYIFRIPKHQEVRIPIEVITLLEKAAKARGDFDIVSAAFQARAAGPIEMHEGVANPEPHSGYYQEPRQEPQGYRPYPVGSLEPQ